TPACARSCVAIGTDRPTATILCTKLRRDRPPDFTLPSRRRNSSSFMAYPIREPSQPYALAILQDACNPLSEQSLRTSSMTVRSQARLAACWLDRLCLYGRSI